LKVLYFPKPCVQADKSTAGLKPRPGAYSRDVVWHFNKDTEYETNKLNRLIVIDL